MTNPLLDFSDLPRFDVVQPDHVAPAIESLMAEYRTLIDELLAQQTPTTWDDFVQPMIDAGEKLSRAWGIVGHLHSVNDVPPWREAYNAMLPEISGFYAELGQNLNLFAKYKSFSVSDEFATLSATRRRIIENELRDFRLSGAELSEQQKPRFKEIQEELSALAAKFSENLLDATNDHLEWITQESDLQGLPADVIAAAAQAAQNTDASARKGNWKFTLHAPSFQPVMQYSDNGDLRARMYRANVTRAAEFGKPEWDNGPLITRILALRAEEATMLGFANYAEVSLAAKMADTPAQVSRFLRDMAAKARPYALRDIAALKEFARSSLNMDTLEVWDMPYASEKLKQARYSFSDDEVKQYFPETKVVEGLFRVIQSLFGVRIARDAAPAWDSQVRFFRIERDGKLLGQFYLDLYARETKSGGAWMDDARGRRLTAGQVQTPVAYLNCNFSAPVGDKQATFTHNDVITLFHECGHGLHHLLTRVDELPVSGIHGVEWDAVELPSQFMENFCWEWDVLQGMTSHVDTGEPLPRTLYDKMVAAKNFMSGMQTLRQIELGLFDLEIHSLPVGAGDTPMQTLAKLRKEFAVVIPPEWNRFPNGFAHIFAGGYAAGYYSYQWAEVLSADAYSAFEDARQSSGTTLDAPTGERFLREILSVGGSRPALESFTAFRGRAPSVDALLRHNGMAVA
ncbi:MAG: M3 family metallopeptidase [Rhodocyclaceae bacterium]|nr:M3 family metallopeptidase [Rhodocyclaceae bacterium]MBP6109466.1 M3 family metallopeptidase [Rhodocyclaceae bacterium]MBP6278602.1 M3 family metallopeptidase [Rhodocyclaceae bacterium]